MEDFQKARKNVKYFQKYMTEFVLKLSQSFPECFDETNMKGIMYTLTPIKDDEIGQYKNINELKGSPVFKYMVKFLNHNFASMQYVQERKLDLFDKKSRSTYGISKTPLTDIDIDFVRLWYSDHITDQLKATVLTYLGLLLTISSESVSLFEVSNKNKGVIMRQKAVRQYRHKEIKKKVYDLLGEGGKNNSINIVVDDILEEFERSKKDILEGQTDPQKLSNMIKGLYGKLTDKYEEGKLDEKELVSSSKNLFSNIMNNDDINLRDNLGQVMELIKSEDNALQEMMQQAGLPADMDLRDLTAQFGKGENPFDDLMKQMSEGDSKEPNGEQVRADSNGKE